MCKRITFSRAHVAMLMELRYGLGFSFREIEEATGVNHSVVYRTIQRAEDGFQFPEVTTRVISFNHKKIDRTLRMKQKRMWSGVNAVEAKASK